MSRRSLPVRIVARAVPLVGSLSTYDRHAARHDLVAGLTTAVMLVPQSMGYALIAGVPPNYGLYASLVPLLVYGLFGTSRDLAIGPVAIISLLVAAAVGSIAQPGTSNYIAYAILLALMVGVVQLAMGIGRLGFLANFLSQPVIHGFTSAVAFIIAASQLTHLLGFRIERSRQVIKVLWSAITRIGHTHLPTLAVGASAIVALLVLKKYARKFPRALAVVAVAAGVSWAFRLDKVGIAIVGNIPQGLPPLSVPELNFGVVRELWPMALAIAMVVFIESIAVAKRYARINKYEVDANRELVGLGLANLVGAFASAYPVAGGFGRTAVNSQAGARTSMAGIITAVTVGLTLLFLTPLFYYLPTAILSAIIITAVIGLIDVREVPHLWKVKRSDLVMLVLTFVATLALGVEPGIAVGVGASLLWLVFKTTRPHVAVLGRLPGTTDYRNVSRFPEAKTIPGILVLRTDAQVYFGNVNFLKETLDRLEREQREPLKAVVVDASGINQVDASGEAAFREVLEGYRGRGIRLLFASLKGPVRDVFARSGFADEVGEDRSFLNVYDAVRAVAGLSAESVAADRAGDAAGDEHPSRSPDVT